MSNRSIISFTERVCRPLYYSGVQDAQVFDSKTRVACKVIGKRAAVCVLGVVASPLGALYHGIHALAHHANGNKELRDRHIHVFTIDIYIGLAAIITIVRVSAVIFNPSVTTIALGVVFIALDSFLS